MKAKSNNKVSRIVAGLAIVAVALSSGALAAEKKEPQRNGDAYPLELCPVSGAKLGSMGEAVVYIHEGREVRFCCKSCVEGFKKNAAQYLKKADTAIVKDQLPFYPLQTCVVSGKKLGSMGKTVDFVYGNRLVRLCCNGCIGRFKSGAKGYFARLNKAVVDKHKGDYPLKTCVVSGEKLGSMGKPVDIVHANRLVRLCCNGCVKNFSKDPAKFLNKLKYTVWTCAMHPEVKTVKAGKCPVCRMKLIPDRSSKDSDKESKQGHGVSEHRH